MRWTSSSSPSQWTALKALLYGIRLFDALISELYTLAVLGTLAAVNLRAGYAPFVSCEPSCRHK